MRRHQHHRPTLIAAVVLAVCGLAAPSAGAMPLYSPQEAAAARDARPVQIGVDLRSADARSAAIEQSHVAAPVDLRSADARSATIEQTQPVRTPVLPAPQNIVQASGFDWGDFGIGAGTALAMVLLAFGAVSLSHRGRTGGSGPSPLAS
jgi:hypothetical protein